MDLQNHQTTINTYLEDTATSINLAECRRLFVGDLRPETRIQHLFKYFVRFGAIENVYIARNFEDGICRGYGFVVFQDRLTLDVVMSLEKHVILDWPVRIKKGHPRVEVTGMLESLSSDDVKRYFNTFGKVIKVGALRTDKNNVLEQVCAVTFHLDEVVQNISTQHVISGVPVFLKTFIPKESASLKIFGQAKTNNAGLGYEDLYSNAEHFPFYKGLTNLNNLADLSVYNAFQNFLNCNNLSFNNPTKTEAENYLHCGIKDQFGDFNRLMCSSIKNVPYDNVDRFNLLTPVENVSVYDQIPYNNLENLLAHANADNSDAYKIVPQNNTNWQAFERLSYNNAHDNVENAYNSLWHSDVENILSCLDYSNTVNYPTNYDRQGYSNINTAQTSFLPYENIGNLGYCNESAYNVATDSIAYRNLENLLTFRKESCNILTNYEGGDDLLYQSFQNLGSLDDCNRSAYSVATDSIAYKNVENLFTCRDESCNTLTNSEGGDDLLYQRFQNLGTHDDDFPCHNLDYSSFPRKVPFSDVGDFYAYINFVYDTIQKFSVSDNLINDNTTHNLLNGHMDARSATYSSYEEFSSTSSESSYGYDSPLFSTAQNVCPYGSIGSMPNFIEKISAWNS